MFTKEEIEIAVKVINEVAGAPEALLPRGFFFPLLYCGG